MLEIDEIDADIVGAERTLRIALNYHANRYSHLRNAKRDFWTKLGEKHGFSPGDGYEIKQVDGSTTVVRMPEAADPKWRKTNQNDQ